MKKITRREFLAVSAVLGAAGALSACGTGTTTATATSTAASSAAVSSAATSAAAATSSAPITFILNEVNPDTSLAAKVAKYLAEQASTLSGGSITVDCRTGGSLLGSEGDVIDDMTGPAPTVDIARIAIMSLDNYGVPTTRLTNVPYVFKSREHFWKFAASDLGTQILTDSDTVGKLGITGKCYYEEGFRNFFFCKPVAAIADMKGMNIRVSTSSLYMEMVKNLGANPVDIAFSELYQSLGGVCEGAEQPIVNYQANSFYEPAPYMILDGHVMGSGMLIMTDAAWDKLDDAQKTAMQTAYDNAAQFCKDTSESAETDARKACEDAGATFTEVADKTPWQDACKQVISDNITGMEDTYQQILALA